MNNYNKYTIIVIITLSLLIPQKFSSVSANNRLTTKQQEKMISQARTLENSGLIEQAIIAYTDILSQFPSLKIAFGALKKIYINREDWIELEKIADNYLKANNHSIRSKIEILDFYIITNNKQWENIVEEVSTTDPMNLGYIKQILSILLKYDKITFASNLTNNIRTVIKDKSFYALELGDFFRLKLDFQKTLDLSINVLCSLQIMG